MSSGCAADIAFLVYSCLYPGFQSPAPASSSANRSPSTLLVPFIGVLRAGQIPVTYPWLVSVVFDVLSDCRHLVCCSIMPHICANTLHHHDLINSFSDINRTGLRVDLCQCGVLYLLPILRCSKNLMKHDAHSQLKNMLREVY